MTLYVSNFMSVIFCQLLYVGQYMSVNICSRYMLVSICKLEYVGYFLSIVLCQSIYVIQYTSVKMCQPIYSRQYMSAYIYNIYSLSSVVHSASSVWQLFIYADQASEPVFSNIRYWTFEPIKLNH